MSFKRSESAREALLKAGSLCFRREGYVATTVDDICTEAGVSKGAFFHHFASKEALAEACLEKWGADMAAMDAAAAYHSIEHPVERLMACMAFYMNIFSSPDQLKSCLAGTIAQECFDSNPMLRQAAHQCFVGGEAMFASLVQQAIEGSKAEVDPAGIARLWMGTIQGALILYKASQDVSVIQDNLRHVQAYIGSLVGAKRRD
ncbi:MAG: TetR/AcrR family transcriptional regulator [Phycisphaerales bacterium]|nr:TetR/AcrR family transcriptional regulator [Phycisphaerales bacterium]MCB9855237.1 TetR/AcrR family transcriptional regulator [Phycisphaerales bacterium]MCB9862830.1 TetR/AcrR family transcriptional regulator [Phycisphaerales bacterium]